GHQAWESRLVWESSKIIGAQWSASAIPMAAPSSGSNCLLPTRIQLQSTLCVLLPPPSRENVGPLNGLAVARRTKVTRRRTAENFLFFFLHRREFTVIS